MRNIMCRTFYKYTLISLTSFMASSGLYFVCLTRWLWNSPIFDYGQYDWRIVPQSLGAFCLLTFSIGLLIVLRGHVRELCIFGAILIVPLLVLVAGLTWQMVTKHADDLLDLSDVFLILMISFFLLIIINVFFLIRNIQLKRKRSGSHRNRFVEVHL